MSEIDTVVLRENVIDALKSVYDPEIPVNIYEMGMIYEVRVEENGYAFVKMTLTTPACPVAGTLPGEVEHRVTLQKGHVRASQISWLQE